MGMWFLTVLFVLSVVGAVIYKVAPDYHVLFWCVTYIAVYFVPCGIFLGNELKFLMPFFVLGVFSSHIQWERMSPWLGAISLVIFAWCSIYYRFDDSYYEMGGSTLNLSFLSESIFRFICGLSGAFVIIWICQFLQRMSLLNSWLLRIGVVTLPIYVLHQKFLLPLRVIHFPCGILGNYFLSLILSALVIELSIIVFHYIKSPILRQIMFGEPWRKITQR